ncbi:putative metalloprotease CJM1_0395 family protein [Zhongshania sp.]|uniref:putative metalloprotease CJM1_0395 family protein n=1 Tax=Zhongshania sp. TaxID=1971902 RepID=UPI002615108E|nr:putative metalloprotease CJM1_0395 family protein [Zhongshania sp.]
MDPISTSSIASISRPQASAVDAVRLRASPVAGAQALAPLKNPESRPINAPAEGESRSRGLIKSDPNLSIFAESGVSPARLAILSAPRLYIAEAEQGDEGVVYRVKDAVFNGLLRGSDAQASETGAVLDESADAEAAQADFAAKTGLEASLSKAEQQQIQAEIQALAARDREVHSHELAHSAAGGRYAGSPSYEFKRGPDGNTYAVNGEVSIDIARAASPQATIDKMQVVKQAALAPAKPSSQDRQVAAEASRIEAEARRELATGSSEEGAEQTKGQKLASAIDRSLASNSDIDTAVPADIKAQRLSSLYSAHSSSVERQPLTLLDSRA